MTTSLAHSSGDSFWHDVLTVVYAHHGLILVGVVVISFMLYFTRKETINRENYARLENTGLYWHFVDIVWVYLYPLFYLIT